LRQSEISSGAKSGALGAPSAKKGSFLADPLLKELLNLWPQLSEEVRFWIMKVARDFTR
jgi:hypothetical protein